MSVEARRGCGYRKVGGLYLVAPSGGVPCERLPVPLQPCPSCGEEIEQTRGFQWAKPMRLLASAGPCAKGTTCESCPACSPGSVLPKSNESVRLGRLTLADVGLFWCGTAFYPSPEDWMKEAHALGISRRVPAIPKGLVLGRTWVFVAHPKAIDHGPAMPGHSEDETSRFAPGLIHAFIPKAVELIVTPSMKTQKWVKDLVKQGVILVEVPEDDPDHAAPVQKKSARKRAMEKHGRKLAKATRDDEDGEDEGKKEMEDEEAAESLTQE